MGNVLKTLILLLLSTASFGQVIQERNASGADRRIILKNGFRLPQVCNVSGNPDLLNYSAFDAKGAMVYDTCANKIKRWSGSAWVAVADSGAGGGGSGDYVDTIYRKAGQDSIFFTINGGTERAVKDSVGSGGGVGSTEYVVSGLGIKVDSSGRAYTVNSDTASSVFLSRQRGDNTFALLRYGNVNNANMRTWNAGPIYASALNVGSSGGATFRDSLNVFMGLKVGDSATTAWGNFFMGNLSGGRLSTGDRNTSIGSKAMGSGATANLTGNSNTSIGYFSLALLRSGNSNTAIGTSAGASILTTNFSTFVGAIAGQFSTGQQNTGIGYGALSASGLTSASSTAVGSAAALNLTGSGTGDFFGAASGFGYTTGTLNSFYGLSSGSQGTSTTNTGSNNVVMGANSFNTNSGLGAIANNRNVSIGVLSMPRVGNAANDNVTIGYGGGNGASTGTSITGKNNIAIGSMSVLPSITADNQITFWTAATGGTGGYNALTRFTGGGWLVNATTSTVTTQTASAALEVNGTTGGVLFPRLTTAQRNAIASPAAGLSVYNSSLATNDVYTTAWYQQPNGLTGSGTLDFPSTGAHSSSDLTITVTGAADGDMVILGVPNASVTNDSNYSAWVSAPNTVTVRFNHYGSGNSNPASGPFKVYVIKN